MEFILVDDSEFDLFTQRKLLLKSGLTQTVRPFNDPLVAIAYLQQQTEEMPETVILLDLQMPGMDGFQFTEAYGRLPQNVRARIKLFMISSTVDECDIEQAGANNYILHLLSKPLEVQVLRRLLGR
jgi:CheY-like chemotaxis protein